VLVGETLERALAALRWEVAGRMAILATERARNEKGVRRLFRLWRIGSRYCTGKLVASRYNPP